ncbi:hypothetical protein CN327_29975 [Bacillus cereus]|nr:hypothetical protein CN327_29975 [Bacillus cereus]PFI44037.1 hypothetical protein COI73_27185 [Bacillus cereus]
MGYLQYTKKRRLTPTDIHLPPKIGVSHLHIFGEGVFCQKTINNSCKRVNDEIRNGILAYI